jgi:hypothetical protein
MGRHDRGDQVAVGLAGVEQDSDPLVEVSR